MAEYCRRCQALDQVLRGGLCSDCRRSKAQADPWQHRRAAYLLHARRFERIEEEGLQHLLPQLVMKAGA